MDTPPVYRLVGFAVALVALFGVAWAAGARVDPETADGTLPHGEMGAGEGFRLVPEGTSFASGEPADLRFRIVDAGGETVRDFDLEHERRMHLIVVRGDLGHFQHLHPRQLPDGSWRAEVELPSGGVYRAFADFAADGHSATLSADLSASGQSDPEPLPEPAVRTDAGDGYEVRLESGDSVADGTLRFAVSRNGRPVRSVEPYLGADGHLVVLREDDLEFLHVHPLGEPGGSGPIAFEVTYPAPARYRLFLQFKHGDEVRTAAFTRDVGGTERQAHAEGGGHGH